MTKPSSNSFTVAVSVNGMDPEQVTLEATDPELQRVSVEQYTAIEHQAACLKGEERALNLSSASKDVVRDELLRMAQYDGHDELDDHATTP